jgi:hypothetical protein
MDERGSASTLQRFNASTIKNNVLGRRIKHRAATDRFAKCFAKVTQARVTNFCGSFRNVVTPGAQ